MLKSTGILLFTKYGLVVMYTSRTIKIVFAIALVGLVSLPSYGANKTINAFTEQLGYLQFYNDNGDLDGYAVEYVQAIANKAGYKVNTTALSWARSYRNALENKNTLIFSISRIESREQSFNWVGSLCKTPLYVWSNKNLQVENANKFDDLREYSFVVTKNSRFEKFLKEHEFKNVITVNSQPQLIGMLLRNQADFTISGDSLMVSKLITNGVDPDAFKKVMKIPSMINDLHVAFSLDSEPEIVERFRQAFKQVDDSPISTRLKNKWALECF